MNPIIDPDFLLEQGATIKRVGKDEVIFREGTHCCFYYQLLEGTVRWVNINEEGKEYLQSLVVGGEPFGDIPLFDDGTYAATAIAHTDASILRLNKNAFLELMQKHPEVHMRFTRHFAESLRFKFMVLKEIASYGPEHCISTLINYFKSRSKFTSENGSRLTLTRQQIADMTGMRVETVIRAIRNLHQQGKLNIERGKVYC